MMKKYDVVVKTAVGSLVATLESPDHIPTGLILQAVMSHQQLVPHLVQLRANEAETLLVTRLSRLQIPNGFTITFHDGVSVNGPLHPSPIENVPREFNGVQLTYNLAAAVTYLVDPTKDDNILGDSLAANDDFDDDYDSWS